jgi:hypothetical protein
MTILFFADVENKDKGVKKYEDVEGWEMLKLRSFVSIFDLFNY